MTLTRDEAINRAIDKLSDLTKEDFHGYRSEIWGVCDRLIKDAPLTTDTEMYEGEPKEEWRKNEEKIEACALELYKRMSALKNPDGWSVHPQSFLPANVLIDAQGKGRFIKELNEILAQHFGGGKP